MPNAYKRMLALKQKYPAIVTDVCINAIIAISQDHPYQEWIVKALLCLLVNNSSAFDEVIESKMLEKCSYHHACSLEELIETLSELEILNANTVLKYLSIKDDDALFLNSTDFIPTLKICHKLVKLDQNTYISLITNHEVLIYFALMFQKFNNGIVLSDKSSSLQSLFRFVILHNPQFTITQSIKSNYLDVFNHFISLLEQNNDSVTELVNLYRMYLSELPSLSDSHRESVSQTLDELERKKSLDLMTFQIILKNPTLSDSLINEWRRLALLSKMEGYNLRFSYGLNDSLWNSKPMVFWEKYDRVQPLHYLVIREGKHNVFMKRINEILTEMILGKLNKMPHHLFGTLTCTLMSRIISNLFPNHDVATIESMAEGKINKTNEIIANFVR